MDIDISHVRRDILTLLLVGTLVGLIFLILVNPIVSNLSPADARRGRLNYLRFGPLLLIGLTLFFTLYLRPIARLATALRAGQAIPREMAQRTRTLAFTIPFRLLYIPVLATFVISTVSDVWAELTQPDYAFMRHYPGSILTVIAAACISLVLSVVSRRILAPVLLVTSGLADDVGPRFDIHRRQFVTTLLLTLIAIAFLGLLGYNQVVHSVRQGLREKYRLLGESVSQDLAVYLDNSALVAYVESLTNDDGYAFIVDQEGNVITWRPPKHQDLELDSAKLARQELDLITTPQGEVVLVPLERTNRDWRLGFVYRVSPLQIPLVQRTLLILSAFVAAMFVIVFVTNRYVADDLTRDIKYVTRRLLDLARGRQVDLEPLHVLSLDEVGDLVHAFNQLQAKLRRQFKEQASLYAASAALTSSLDVQTILTTLAQQFTEVLEVEGCAISDWDTANDRLVIRVEHAVEAWEDTDPPGTVYELDEYPATSQVLESGEPLTVLLSDPTADRHERDLMAQQEIKSLLMLPLTIKGRAIGLVELMESKKERRFAADEIRLAQALAQQAAVVLENARLFQDVQDRARELTLLHEISQRLSALLDLEALLREIVNRVTEVFGYQVASVHLTDETTSNLVLVAQTGIDEAFLRQPGQKLGDKGIVPWVATHGRPLLVPDVRQDERYVESTSGIRSELAVPLLSGDEVVGVFNLESDEINAFDESDARLMTVLAHQITVALENARLFESVRDQAAELARMADDLTQEKSKLDAILHNIADGLIVTDPGNDVLLVNPAFEGMFRRPGRALVGRPLDEEIVGPELVRLVHSALQDPEPQAAFVAEVPRPGGRTLKASSAAIREDQRLLGVVTVLRDITHEKEVDRIKTDFISTVSHELRTPLTSVLGFAKLINKAFDKDVLPRLPTGDRKGQRAARRISQNLEIIVDEGERLTRLINDVLDIAKMEAGKIEWSVGPVFIDQVVRSAVAATSALAQAKGLPVGVDVQADLPPVQADHDRLIQVVTNLLSNAIKFTDQGRVRVWARRVEVTPDGTTPDDGIKAQTLAPGPWLAVSVQDSGVGIAPENWSQVFERFKQVGDVTTDRPKGTGLGLPISKEIVEHHGGRIWLESEPSQGSTFTFALPLIPAPAPETRLVDEIRRRVTETLPSTPEKGRRILVVDDEDNIRNLLRQELSEAGYQVLEAVDGAEALQKARQERPDLIILDVMMPGISGFDVASALRSDPATADFAIVILSIIEDRERGARLGVDGYLTKPVDSAKLLQSIAETLERVDRGAGHKKVLIIDEDASVIESITQVLRERGYQIVEAHNGHDGLEKARQERPDLILLDALISQVNNYEVLRALRYEAETRDASVIVLTASMTADEILDLLPS